MITLLCLILLGSTSRSRLVWGLQMLDLRSSSHNQLTTPVVVTRSRFLSSTAAAFLASATLVMTLETEECQADVPMTNPRYIEQELEMKYGEDASMYGVILFLSLLFVID